MKFFAWSLLVLGACGYPNSRSSHSLEIRKESWARRGLLDRLFAKLTPLVRGLL